MVCSRGLANILRNRLSLKSTGIEKYGLVQHADSRGWSSAAALRDHIVGKLAFAVSVEPVFAARMRDRLGSAF